MFQSKSLPDEKKEQFLKGYCKIICFSENKIDKLLKANKLYNFSRESFISCITLIINSTLEINELETLFTTFNTIILADNQLYSSYSIQYGLLLFNQNLTDKLRIFLFNTSYSIDILQHIIKNTKTNKNVYILEDLLHSFIELDTKIYMHFEAKKILLIYSLDESMKYIETLAVLDQLEYGYIPLLNSDKLMDIQYNDFIFICKLFLSYNKNNIFAYLYKYIKYLEIDMACRLFKSLNIADERIEERIAKDYYGNDGAIDKILQYIDTEEYKNEIKFKNFLAKEDFTKCIELLPCFLSNSKYFKRLSDLLANPVFTKKEKCSLLHNISFDNQVENKKVFFITKELKSFSLSERFYFFDCFDNDNIKNKAIEHNDYLHNADMLSIEQRLKWMQSCYIVKLMQALEKSSFLDDYFQLSDKIEIYFDRIKNCVIDYNNAKQDNDSDLKRRLYKQFKELKANLETEAFYDAFLKKMKLADFDELDDLSIEEFTENYL